ncbi:hypothetical protein [Sulfuracidifex tepidarius]|nr:hypothetical protein [Sulfuracidifex tepidarius]BBG27085.1 hypothetical protein IC007_1615 [Sulfuracidifex tepidarius]
MIKLKELEYHYANINEALAFLLASLSLAVAYIVEAPSVFSVVKNPLYSIILILIPIVVGVLTIVPHELAHRQMARRFGCGSRFILSFRGFLITLLINLFHFITGFLVFFSGYTGINCYFGGNFDTKIQGKTAAAGPATNIAISVVSIVIFYLLIFIEPHNLIRTNIGFFFVEQFFLELSNFNAYVAFFNLIPFWVLDGLKIIRWDIKVWIALLIPSLILTFVAPFGY